VAVGFRKPRLGAWPQPLLGCLCELYSAVFDYWFAACACHADRLVARWAALAGKRLCLRHRQMAELEDICANSLLGRDDRISVARAGTTLLSPQLLAIRVPFTVRRSRTDAACRLFLATYLADRRLSDELIRLRPFYHLATVAPAGAGMDVSALTPKLLSHRDSCVVMDPKGENFRLTGGHRKQSFGHAVMRIDLFDVVRRYHVDSADALASDSLSPFDLVDPNSHDLNYSAAHIANVMIVRNQDENEPHWTNSAEMYRTAFIAFVLARAESLERILQPKYELLADPVAHEGALKLIRQFHSQHRMLKCRGSALTTTGRHGFFLDSERLATFTPTTPFDPGQLLAGDITSSLCLPGNHLHAHAGFVRLLLICLVRAFACRGPQENNQLLRLVGEATHIGHLPCLADAIALLRGDGVRLWFCFQSFGQLEGRFGEKAFVFQDAIESLQFFGLLPSAEPLSSRIGDASIAFSIYQDSRSRLNSYQTGAPALESMSYSTRGSMTHAEIGRRPADVGRDRPRPRSFWYKRQARQSFLPFQRGKHCRHWTRAGAEARFGYGTLLRSNPCCEVVARDSKTALKSQATGSQPPSTTQTSVKCLDDRANSDKISRASLNMGRKVAGFFKRR
jgi:type IV secretion system protein VirD4